METIVYQQNCDYEHTGRSGASSRTRRRCECGEEGLIFGPPSRIMRMHQLLNECTRGGDLRSRSGGEERRDDGGALYQFASSGSNSVIDVFHEVRKDGVCRLFHYEVWSRLALPVFDLCG